MRICLLVHGVVTDAYFNAKEKMMYFINLFKDNLSINGNTINIRLAGDGSIFAKNMNVFNFSFGFLDAINDIGKLGTNPNCATGNFLLGLFECGEEYEKLRDCLKDLLDEISEITEIEIDDNVFNIIFHLGGDLKFILLVLGLKSAGSNNPCPLCYSHKNEFDQFYTDLYKVRTIGDFSQGGQERIPIIDFIPSDRVVPDLLHADLRITDRLQENFCLELEELDTAYSIAECINQKKYCDFLDSIKIRKAYKPNVKDSKYDMRGMNGEEKKKLFELIDLEAQFQGIVDVDKKNKLWKSIKIIINYCKSENICSTSLKQQTEEWYELYKQLYGKNNITPYIHILTHFHILENNLQQKNMTLNDFSMQGIEKLNGLLKNYYHSASNRQGDSLVQVLKKRNRIELITHDKEIKSSL